jgi:hypothetical protein
MVFGVMRYSDLEGEDAVILEQELTEETVLLKEWSVIE